MHEPERLRRAETVLGTKGIGAEGVVLGDRLQHRLPIGQFGDAQRPPSLVRCIPPLRSSLGIPVQPGDILRPEWTAGADAPDGSGTVRAIGQGRRAQPTGPRSRSAMYSWRPLAVR